MPITTRNLLDQYTEILQKIYGKHLKKVILYGSYARGDYRDDSDIDIMILTSLSNMEIEKIENKIFDVAFEFEMEYGIVINPVLENEEHFNYWLGALPFYDNVKKEGVEIG
mgnify:CR=1 FL=1